MSFLCFPLVYPLTSEGKITEEVVYDIAIKAKPTDVKEMLDLILKGNFADAIKRLSKSFNVVF